MEGVVTRTAARPAVLSEEVSRFDIHQRIQHLGLMVSFILLALTGLPLKFYDWQVSQWWVDVWGGIDNLRWVHHYAAWVMVFVCVYHLGYIAYTTIVLKRPFPVKIIPNYRDFANFFQEFRYFLGFTKERPKYHRFNWREKFDYWAIFWGIPVMAGSGFILMYPVFATEFLPGWMVPVSLVAHSDEALLAVVWIFTVHFVFNHLAPGVIPLNKSIFTGKIPRERYRLEHPLEYEEMYGSTEEEED